VAGWAGRRRRRRTTRRRREAAIAGGGEAILAYVAAVVGVGWWVVRIRAETGRCHAARCYVMGKSDSSCIPIPGMHAITYYNCTTVR
jgi:hypothetical protein